MHLLEEYALGFPASGGYLLYLIQIYGLQALIC